MELIRGEKPKRKQRLPGCGSGSKESACNAGDLIFIPGLGRSPGGGNVYPLQYSCLENSFFKSHLKSIMADEVEVSLLENSSHQKD